MKTTICVCPAAIKRSSTAAAKRSLLSRPKHSVNTKTSTRKPFDHFDICICAQPLGQLVNSSLCSCALHVTWRWRMFVDNGHLCLIASLSAVLMRSWERQWDWQRCSGMVRLFCTPLFVSERLSTKHSY